MGNKNRRVRFGECQHLVQKHDGGDDPRHVQLLGGNSKELHSGGVGALMVAMTISNLLHQENGEAKELRLYKGNVQWFPGATPTFKNSGLPALWFWK